MACPRRGVLETYGKVLFRAWRHAQADPSHEAYLARLEDCIQQAMHAAVHARTTSLFGALRHVLAQFHAQKAVRGVDEMLKRLYEGFLWRSLGAANPTVRLQALTLQGRGITIPRLQVDTGG